MARRRSHPRLLGLLLVLVALALLVAGSGGEEPGTGVFLFLLPFLPGMLLLLGLIGRPHDLPDAPPASAAGERVPPAEPREFRYRTGRAGYAVVWVLAALLGLGGGLLLALVPGATGDTGALVFGGALLAATGAGLGFYAWRRPRCAIRVDAQGIRSGGLVRTVSVPWSEVVALRTLSVRSGAGFEVGKIHRVFSARRVVAFSDSIRDLEDLLAIVRRATGLEW